MAESHVTDSASVAQRATRQPLAETRLPLVAARQRKIFKIIINPSSASSASCIVSFGHSLWLC